MTTTTIMESTQKARKNQTRVHLGPNTTIIPTNAFQNSCKLQEVQFHDKVQYIESQAFQKCVALQKVIGMRIHRLGLRCLDGCVLLKQVHLMESSVKVLTRATFRNCVSLETVSFPSTLAIIAKDAFRGCQSLRSVNLRQTQLEIIGQGAFARCSRLTKIDFADSLHQIGRKAFLGCSVLGELELSCKVTWLRPQVFQDCSQLKTVVLLHSKTCKVDKTAFANCRKLQRLVSRSSPPAASKSPSSSITQLQHQVATAKQDILQLSDRFQHDLRQKETDLQSTLAQLDQCRLAIQSKNVTIQQLALEKQQLVQELQVERSKRQREVAEQPDPAPKRVKVIHSSSTDGSSSNTGPCNVM